MEVFDVYDRAGNVTGKTRTREEPFLEGEYLLGASLWIVSPTGKLLIQKRAPGKRIHPNKWSITGGAVCAGETSAQGCIREVWEEIGLRLEEDEIAFFSRSHGVKILFDDYIIIRDYPIESAVLQTEEVSEIRWVTMQQARELFLAGDFMMDQIEDLDRVDAYIRENICGSATRRQDSAYRASIDTMC